MTVNLSKGQRISLEKTARRSLTRVVMGLGWDARNIQETRKVGGFLGLFTKDEVFDVKQSIDLDASCVMFDRAGDVVDTVWFKQLKSRCGALVHTGDNRTGDGDGDDEQIIVDLPRIDGRIRHLIFVVNSFTGESFAEIENAVCRMVDSESNTEIARFELSGGGHHTAQLMVRLSRDDNGWTMQALGVPCNGQTFVDLLPTIKPYLV